tara:strand:- start:464 stop:808 length:345 start_codon:yes stop_codon:yes gene_type:complete
MANTFRLKTKANLTTTLADVYEVDASTTTIVLGISLSNKSNASKTADILIVTDTSHSGETNADSYLGYGLPIPAGGTLEVMSGNKLVLQTTDKIQAKASAGSAVDIIVSIMEIA